jgi:hypothetical protein
MFSIWVVGVRFEHVYNIRCLIEKVKVIFCPFLFFCFHEEVWSYPNTLCDHREEIIYIQIVPYYLFL